MRRRAVTLAFALALLSPLFAVVNASAELVVLTNGRVFSVRSAWIEEGTAVLALRGGGQVSCPASYIDRIDPDEVPYPEPEPPQAEAAPVGTGDVMGRPFAELIEPLALQYGVDSRLVRALIEAESNYQPAARSPKGAMGLMQLMPQTARRYDVANPFDPRSNLDAGIRHLRMLLDRYTVSLALAAYNAGEGAVLRYGGVPPFRETREYVARILRRAGFDRRRT